MTRMRRPRRLRARNAIRTLGLLVAAFVIACASAWGAGLLYFAGPGEQTRAALAFVPLFVGSGAIVALFVPGWRQPGLLIFGVMLATLIIWFSSIRPSNDRE